MRRRGSRVGRSNELRRRGADRERRSSRYTLVIRCAPRRGCTHPVWPLKGDLITLPHLADRAKVRDVCACPCSHALARPPNRFGESQIVALEDLALIASRGLSDRGSRSRGKIGLLDGF